MGPYTPQLQAPPGPLSFPSNFNPHAVKIWFAATDPHTLKDLDSRSAWKTAISRYEAGCSEAGLSPFVHGEQDTNIAIRNYLYHERQPFVRFLNVTKLMQGLKIVRRIERHARVEHYGFSIKVEAHFVLNDPTWIQRLWRLDHGYRFNRIRDPLHRYTMELDPGLLVFVYNQGTMSPNRWIIGYEIRCPIAPVYPQNGEIQGKEQFILQGLWQPLVDGYRARNLDRIRHL